MYHIPVQGLYLMNNRWAHQGNMTSMEPLRKTMVKHFESLRRVLEPNISVKFFYTILRSNIMYIINLRSLKRKTSKNVRDV